LAALHYQEKEEYMKKVSIFTLGFLVLFMAFSVSSFSATINDMAGTWDTYSDAKLKISGIGSFSDENFSVTTLDLANTFVLTETSSTGTYYYSGDFSLIDGKKLSFELDLAGRTELISTWIDWAKEIALENGVVAEDINFNIESLTVSRPSINKRTLIPKKTTIKAKGRATARIDGEFFDKKFSYTSKVSFIGR
jgi:hypothetical protein